MPIRKIYSGISVLRKVIFAAVAWAALALPALAQSGPGFPLTYGYVPTQAQWSNAFTSKQDYLGAPPLLTTGGTMTGPLVTVASITANAGLNVPPGTAPTSPVNGDIWTTSAGLFAQINGATVGPFTGSATPCTNCALTTNPLSQFAATTSAQLAGVISNETGTGLLVFNNSPALVTPALGAATATTLAVAGCSLPGGAVLCATGNITTTSGFIGSQIFGGTGTAQSLSVTTTTSGSASGDVLSLSGSTVNIGGVIPASNIINLGTLLGGGITINIASSSNGLQALNVYNNAGSKQQWIPGGGNTVITFPTATDTLVGKATTDTLTNKTIASSTDILGGVTMGLGSDATGDIYYNSGGIFTRLAKAANGTVLELVAGLPSWQSVSGTGTVTSVNTIAGTGISISGTCNSTSATSCTVANTGVLSIASQIGALTIAAANPLTNSGTVLSVTQAAKSDQQTGTSNAVAVTPLHQQDHDSAEKAWVYFTSVNPPVVAAGASYNVSGVVRNSAGNFTISFTTPFANANYVCTVTPGAGVEVGYLGGGTPKAAGSVVVISAATSFTPTDAGALDVTCRGRQ